MAQVRDNRWGIKGSGESGKPLWTRGAARRKEKGVKSATACPQYKTVPNTPPLLCLLVTSKCVESNPPAFSPCPFSLLFSHCRPPPPPTQTLPVIACPTVPQAKSLWVPWIWTVEYPRTDPTAKGRQRAPPKPRGGDDKAEMSQCSHLLKLPKQPLK